MIHTGYPIKPYAGSVHVSQNYSTDAGANIAQSNHTQVPYMCLVGHMYTHG